MEDIVKNKDKDSGGNVNRSNMRYLTQLMESMSKYTILILVSICTTIIIFCISFGIVTAFFDDESIIGFIVTTMIISFDSITNVVCLILQFEFSKSFYWTVCIKCHRKCEDRYTTKANKNQKDAQVIRLENGNFGIQRKTGVNIEKTRDAHDSAQKQEQESMAVIGAQGVLVLDA